MSYRRRIRCERAGTTPGAAVILVVARSAKGNTGVWAVVHRVGLGLAVNDSEKEGEEGKDDGFHGAKAEGVAAGQIIQR